MSEQQPTPNSVEALRKLWTAADKAANSPAAREAAKERIRETMRKLRRPRDDEASR